MTPSPIFLFHLGFFYSYSNILSAILLEVVQGFSAVVGAVERFKCLISCTYLQYEKGV
jgi:hypothetical protein